MTKMTVESTIDNLTHPEKSLSQRAVRSGAWVFLLRVIQQLFSLTRLLILARILAPHDFGLMGIALLSMATLETFSQTGFQQALIQKKYDIKPYLDSAWTFLILRGVILFAILYLIAPYAAVFFDASEAKPIIQVIGLSVIFQAFTNIGVIHFQKELEFNKQFIYQLSGTLTDFVVAVAAVLILGNVWALVFGLLAGKAAMFITSYLLHPYRPHLSFDVSKMKELFGYGKWIFGSSILVFLLTQGDDIVVGKILGITALGFYQMAYLISNLPATEITRVISQVTFPVYSKLQDEIPKLKQAFLTVVRLTAFMSFPIAGLIFVLAPDFTMIFLGEKWMPMVPAMQVLVWWGVIRGLVGAISPVFMSIGKPKIITKLQTVQTVLLFILIYPLTVHWGIYGASFAVFLSAFSMLFVRNHILIKAIKCRIWEFYKPIIFPLIFTMVSIFSIFSFKLLNINLTLAYSFVAYIGIFVLVFISLSYIADRFSNYGIQRIIKEVFNLL